LRKESESDESEAGIGLERNVMVEAKASNVLTEQ